ncbi:hypothetical protein ZIOFF_021472 [Zingiber officinale]|uniref:Uncharacterized protein n=1 Tax=Zingiber officinale TaxID=94328 RepID=A0A8J5L8M3_ZINOF|nr:hypothetical protein ZIOFF_021472 [Zingiber officinale]
MEGTAASNLFFSYLSRPSSTPVKVHAVPIPLFAITNMARSWSSGQRILVFHPNALLFSLPLFVLASASC